MKSKTFSSLHVDYTVFVMFHTQGQTPNQVTVYYCWRLGELTEASTFISVIMATK